MASGTRRRQAVNFMGTYSYDSERVLGNRRMHEKRELRAGAEFSCELTDPGSFADGLTIDLQPFKPPRVGRGATETPFLLYEDTALEADMQSAG